jgi:hypothetical protein
MPMETRISDYAAFLRDLGASKADYFLGGGQAVNFWAEFYSNKGAGDAIERFLPFTSKDCDLWVSFSALRHIQSNARGGKLIKGTSPADGQIGIFTLEGERPLRIDLMSNVYGIMTVPTADASFRRLLGLSPSPHRLTTGPKRQLSHYPAYYRVLRFGYVLEAVSRRQRRALPRYPELEGDHRSLQDYQEEGGGLHFDHPRS